MFTSILLVFQFEFLVDLFLKKISVNFVEIIAHQGCLPVVYRCATGTRAASSTGKADSAGKEIKIRMVKGKDVRERVGCGCKPFHLQGESGVNLFT